MQDGAAWSHYMAGWFIYRLCSEHSLYTNGTLVLEQGTDKMALEQGLSKSWQTWQKYQSWRSLSE